MPSPIDDPGAFQVILVAAVVFVGGAYLNEGRRRLVARWRRRHRA